MAVGIKSVTVGTVSLTATATVTTSESPSTTAVGDLVVVVHCNDFYLLSNMPTPTATGSPTLTAVTNGSADAGSNNAHIKTYTYTANTAGAQTVSVTETGAGDEEKVLVVYVLSGADTASPIDGGSSGAAGNFSATSTSPHVAPAVTPSGSNAFLIAHTNSGGGSAGSAPYTPPGGMTERYDVASGGIAFTGATEQLAASGSTGTRSFTVTASTSYAAVTIAIKTGAATPQAEGTQNQYVDMFAMAR